MNEVCQLLATLGGGGGKGTGTGNGELLALAGGGGKGTGTGKGECAVFLAWIEHAISQMASKFHALGYAQGRDNPNRAWYEKWEHIVAEARQEGFKDGFKEGTKKCQVDHWNEAWPTLRDFLFLCGSLVLPWPFLGSGGYRNDREPYRAPSGLDISPCGAIIWTHFKPNSTNSSKKNFGPGPGPTVFGPGPSPRARPKTRSKTWS